MRFVELQFIWVWQLLQMLNGVVSQVLIFSWSNRLSLRARKRASRIHTCSPVESAPTLPWSVASPCCLFCILVNINYLHIHTWQCFLLAMADSIETPFRICDEFDVYMDAVARTTAFHLIVAAAEKAKYRQVICMTCKDIGSGLLNIQ